MSDVHLTDLRWPEVPAGATVLVPVGSLEQHGPHLPFDTDTRIASAAADLAADRLREEGRAVIVAPPLPLGASGEHQAFPGTVSIGHAALRLVLVELVRSLSTWADRTVVVNGHGGNLPTLRDAVAQMRAEGHDVSWFPCAFESTVDAHAGVDETSVMLHLDPSRVAIDRAEPGRTEPLAQLLPDLMTLGVRPVSPNGVLGDPTSADAGRGAVLLAGLVDALVRAVTHGAAGSDGLLAVPTTGARRG
jgi:mycofactocin precursor peptide peptidase